jgi:clan AA aspartic protease
VISGSINSELEPIVRLEVRGPAGTARHVDAILDTGFNGFLTLPANVIRVLALPFHGRETAILADGRVEVLDVYLADVAWEGGTRPVQVQLVDAHQLLGMDLLLGYDVLLRVAVGGPVTITATP